MDADRNPSRAPATAECRVVELRQYRLRPHRRDALIELFDREFIEPQEAAGMRVIGQFRDLDDPDRFVWLRGFASMAARRRGLEAFYGGPVWARFRDAANATMIDSDDVLLLRPAWAGAAIAPKTSRADRDGSPLPDGLLEATTYYLREPPSDALLELARGAMAKTLAAAGVLAKGWYVTEPSGNDYPRLPVREGEQVLVQLALFRNLAAFEGFVRSGIWTREVAPRLAPFLVRLPEMRRLVPTARSALRA